MAASIYMYKNIYYVGCFLTTRNNKTWEQKLSPLDSVRQNRAKVQVG